ncbi:MAG: MFS transporter [Devosia sp.]
MKTGSWSELVAPGYRLSAAVFAGGVAINAIEVYIGSTLMPSVVADIGGIDLFAWVTTVFVVASIAASMFAAVRPFGLGPRQNYLIAAAAFGIGSLICGAAPSMPVLLVGRAIQGFGAGLLGALVYMMVRIVFPERLWARAFALVSSMWAIATLVGPAIGGVFAEFGAWRWAFFALVPLTVLLAWGAVAVVPSRSKEAGMTKLPTTQIALMMFAVLALSSAGALAYEIRIAATLTFAAIVSIVSMTFVERRSIKKLFPTGTFVLGTSLATLFGTMVLLQMSITSDVFVPLFLQNLHGLGPLAAGYIVALLAVGWSASSMITAGWTGARARFLIASGPIVVFASAIVLALLMGRNNSTSNLAILVPIGAALVLMGLGIGSTWTQMTPRVMLAAPPGENDLTSAALSTIQLFASGMAAALGGLIVNLAGLASGTGSPSVAANWLYGLFVLLPLFAIPLGLAIARRDNSAAALTQPAE